MRFGIIAGCFKGTHSLEMLSVFAEQNANGKISKLTLQSPMQLFCYFILHHALQVDRAQAPTWSGLTANISCLLCCASLQNVML